VRVALDLDRGRHRLRDRPQVRDPARTVELFAARELDLDRQRVDALAALQERTRRVVDQPVARDVEVVRAKEVGDLEDRVPVDEQAPEDLLLGAIVERHLPLGAAYLKRHLRSIERTF